MDDVTVVDLGICNVKSVVRAIEHVGFTTEVTSDHRRIQTSRNLVLPGVGSFPAAMRKIRDLGLDEALHNAVAAGGKLLGICLGMQVLFQESQEIQETAGLGFFEGQVKRIPGSREKDGGPRLVPHVGWKPVQMTEALAGNEIKALINGASFYFTHSFCVEETQDGIWLGTTFIDDFKFLSVVQSSQVMGFQFHPEKSGKDGLALLKHALSGS